MTQSAKTILLLPRPLSQFILAEQARDLLSIDGVVAVPPPATGYGAYLRVPKQLGSGTTRALARRQAQRIVTKHGQGAVKRIVIFHASQAQVATALIGILGCELWYWRWDRYESAEDASPQVTRRLNELHQLAMSESDLVIASSSKLRQIALQESPQTRCVLAPLSADNFPAPQPTASLTAFSLGHLGRRIDWPLLQALGKQLPQLQLLLVGEVHHDENHDEPAFHWCMQHPNFVFLGRQGDQVAAQLLRQCDVNILPFKIDDFNDAGLPYRILKAARLGRKTVVPNLAGCQTWPQAIVVADGHDQFVQAVAEQAGVAQTPDLELRDWALQQTAGNQNQQLRELINEDN